MASANKMRKLLSNNKDYGFISLEYNTLNGSYMCSVNNAIGHVYVIKGLKAAQKFCQKIQADFENGTLTLVDGDVVKKKETK